eukprot:Skav215243  [mRNA]  locus=scaffold811:129577:132292:+ [translate_table: standard]
MLGVVAGVGRVALTNALRQVGREFGREAMRRIIGGEAIENVLTREQMRDLAKQTGQTAFNELLRLGKEEFIKDTDKKQQDLNKRMDNFNRNLNDKFRENTTLYKEERNIANKEKMEDRWGLTNAYRSPSGLYRSGKTLYISGTGGKDGDFTKDWIDNFTKLPFRNAQNTQKYRDTMEALKKNPDVSRLVSHSLSSAVVNKINEEMPNRFTSTTYATPTIKKKRHGKQDPRRLDFRNPNDIVSILDGYAETSDFKGLNPIIQHTYKNFEEQGIQYITSRRFVNFFPSGSNVYAPNQGNKNIRFNLSADDNTYIDLSSIRVFGTLQNTDTDQKKFLRPLAGLHAFFQRYQLNVAGQQVQDIIEYNRHCELYECLKPKNVRDMDDIESGANPRWDSDFHDYATGLDVFLQPKTDGDTDGAGVVTVTTGGDHNEFGRNNKNYTRHSLTGIPGNQGKARFSHKPCCGLLNSNYYIPLRYAPLELQFQIVSDGNEPIVVPTDGAGGKDDTKGYYFTTGDVSTSWELNNVFIRAEVISLDNTVNNNIVKHLLDGQSLKLVFPMYHTITQSFNAGGGEINMNIVKSSSKLTGAFITLYRNIRTGDGLTDAGEFQGRYLPDNYVYKRWNYFYNPMINKRINNSGLANTDALKGEGFQSWSKNLSWQIQLSNSQKYPEFEAQSLSETFYFLRRAIHYMNENQDSLSFSYRQYRENKFIIGMSFEKMADVNFTGYNSKMSGITNFKIKGTEGALPADEQIQEIFCHLISEAVLELRESGAVVFD